MKTSTCVRICEERVMERYPTTVAVKSGKGTFIYHKRIADGTIDYSEILAEGITSEGAWTDAARSLGLLPEGVS